MGSTLQLKAMTNETLEELHTKMAKLEEKKDPHALDEEMPMLANRLAEVFHQRHPAVHLLNYEDAKTRLLAQAESMGAAPIYNAGLQQPGESYAAMLQRRLAAIDKAPLLQSTQILLPIAYFLNQQNKTMKDFIESSVPMTGSTDSAYYCDLLRDSIAFLLLPPSAASASVQKPPVETSTPQEAEDQDLKWALAESLEISQQPPLAPDLPPPDAPRSPEEERDDDLEWAIAESLRLSKTHGHRSSAALGIPSSGFPVNEELAETLARRRAKIDKGIS